MRIIVQSEGVVSSYSTSHLVSGQSTCCGFISSYLVNIIIGEVSLSAMLFEVDDVCNDMHSEIINSNDVLSLKCSAGKCLK